MVLTINSSLSETTLALPGTKSEAGQCSEPRRDHGSERKGKHSSYQTHTSTPATYSVCCTVKSSGSQLTGKNPVLRSYAQAPDRGQLQVLFWPQPPSIYSVNLPAMSLIAGSLKQHRGSSASRRISGKLRSSLPFKKSARCKSENVTFPHW